MADSIKNHLCRFFNEWINLHDHVVNVTQPSLNQLIEYDRNILMMLKLKSQVQPDIDVFTLQVIITNFIKRIKLKISYVKEQCQRNNLKEAMLMRIELHHFKR